MPILRAVLGNRDAPDDARGQIRHEDIFGVVGVSQHEIGGQATEHHLRVVRRKLEAAGVGVERAGGSVRKPRPDALEFSCRQVFHEVAALGVVRHQVGRRTDESKLGAIGREDGKQRAAIDLAAVDGNDRDTGDGPGCQVLDEDVDLTVGIARDEVGARTRERHLGSVGRQDGGRAFDRHAGLIGYYRYHPPDLIVRETRAVRH